MAGRRNNSKLHFDPLNIIVISILASVASFGRFYQLAEKLVFYTDQGRALLAARNILQGQFTLVGPETSVSGFHLGPFYYYLTALALWFTHYNPIGPAIMTASFGIATVLLLYWYGKRSWGLASGVVMALAYALSPHAIWQSRIAIEPSPLPFFSIAWLMSFTLWFEKKQLRWLWFSLIISLLAIQLNFSAVVLLFLSSGWLLWEYTPQLSLVWKKRAIIMAGASILGIMIGHGLARGVTSLAYFWKIWQQLTFPELPWIAIFWVVLFELIAIAFGIQWKRQQLQAPEKALLFWFVTLVSGFLIKHVSGEHALALLFPFPAIILGLSLAKLPVFSRTSYLWATIPALLIFMSFQSLRFLESRQPVSIRDHEMVVQDIIALSGNQPYQLIYRGHLDVYDAADDHYQYLLWLANHAQAASSRIDTQSQNQEKWLLTTSQRPVNRIFIYSSQQEAERYHDSGHFVESNRGVLLRVEPLE